MVASFCCSPCESQVYWRAYILNLNYDMKFLMADQTREVYCGHERSVWFFGKYGKFSFKKLLTTLCSFKTVKHGTFLIFLNKKHPKKDTTTVTFSTLILSSKSLAGEQSFIFLNISTTCPDIMCYLMLAQVFSWFLTGCLLLSCCTFKGKAKLVRHCQEKKCSTQQQPQNT